MPSDLSQRSAAQVELPFGPGCVARLPCLYRLPRVRFGSGSRNRGCGFDQSAQHKLSRQLLPCCLHLPRCEPLPGSQLDCASGSNQKLNACALRPEYFERGLRPLGSVRSATVDYFPPGERTGAAGIVERRAARSQRLRRGWLRRPLSSRALASSLSFCTLRTRHKTGSPCWRNAG